MPANKPKEINGHDTILGKAMKRTSLVLVNAFGSGGFDFSVNDPAPYTAASQFGNTRTLTGQIANLSFTPSGSLIAASPTAAVPETASFLLFAVGLAGLPFFRKLLRLGQLIY